MSVTKLVWQYIDGHPSIKDCIKNRLINYSQLSRKIIKTLNLSNDDFDAVLIACRRYHWQISKAYVLEEKIIDLLAKSKVEVKNKVAVVVLNKAIYSEDLIGIEKKAKRNDAVFYAIEGSKAITLVVSVELLEEIKKVFESSVRKSWKDLALVVIKSPEDLQDTTPGFVSFLTGKISHQGVNILEIMSCWSETLLVVNEKDISMVLSAIK